MLGNSSSGVIEAGMFGLPVINVGDRQKGRERGANVIDVPSDPAAILGALDRVASDGVRVARGTPYGDGAAAPRVAVMLREVTGVRNVPTKSASSAQAVHA